MRAPGLAIGDALIAWHLPQISLPLKSYAWRKTMANDPVYPAHPVEDCNRIVLRLFTEDDLAKVGRVVDFDFAFSLYYYRLQVPGEDHQRVLIDETEQIKAPLLSNFIPEPIVIAGADYFAPIQTVYRGELRNPNIDDPARRVSVSEIVLNGKSHDNAF